MKPSAEGADYRDNQPEMRELSAQNACKKETFKSFDTPTFDKISPPCQKHESSSCRRSTASGHNRYGLMTYI